MICKRVQEKGLWRRRYNFELYQIYELPPANKRVKYNHLRWIGHVERLPDENSTKRIFKTIPFGKRSAGRPKKRFIGAIMNDLKKLGIRNCLRAARDRNKWKVMLKEAKAHLGL